MFFLNLTAGEFLAFFVVLGGAIAALYLLDRSKRKRVVSTLKFWTPAAAAPENQRRRRVQDPWSLVLQLVSLLLLLLAIAQLEWGSRQRPGRNHVVLVDTSAWSAQRDGSSTLLDREKQVAERYVAALAPADRIMLARADALVVPETPLTSDRAALTEALRKMTPGYSALNIDQALRFGRQAQDWSGGERGDVVYIGPGMVSERDVAPPHVPNLRIIAVERGREHVGIRALNVQRSEDGWQAAVTVKNYGRERTIAQLYTRYAGTAFAPRAVPLEGGAETDVEYKFVTSTAGQLVAELRPDVDRMGDERVTVELPRLATLRVAVFTDRPEVFKPLLDANDRLSVRFVPASEADAEISADVMILDRTARTVPRGVASIWIEPPRESSPLPVKAIVRGAAIRNWHSETRLGEGLHARDTRIESAEVFQTFDGDITIAEVAEGPVAVARGPSDSRGHIAVIGFDPLDREARLDVTTPLLFANLLGWISPDVFRPTEIVAQPVGAVAVPLDASERGARVRVVNQRGISVPFIAAKQNLELFAGMPEVLRITSDSRTRVLSVTVPDVAAFEWHAPADAATGLPSRAAIAPGARDLWRWLAALGGLGLLLEWILFGGRRVFRRKSSLISPMRQPAAQQQEELVAK